jgi:lipocalin
MKTLALALALLSGIRGGSVPSVDDIDITKYTGRWYQMSSDRLVSASFERGAACVTADYSLDTDPDLGTIVRLVNSQRDGGVDGDLSNVTGIAYIPDDTEPAELSVKFDPPVPSFVVGSYWVVALGPLDANDQYAYAVTTDSNGQSLFVLARDVAEYRTSYASEVDAFLEANGFTGVIYGAIETEQDGCSYAPEPTAASAAASAGSLRGFNGVAFDGTCPGSGASLFHTGMKITTTAAASCATVDAELTARIAGQYAAWHDPHNNGTYYDADFGGDASFTRVTGDLKYTGKMTFTLVDGADADSCVIQACSESQVTSLSDFGTNYCNLKMLYCGSADGCVPVGADFTVGDETTEGISMASVDLSSCLQV